MTVLAKDRVERVIAHPGNAPEQFQTDHRFRNLVDLSDWNRLPEATRRRFTKHVTQGRTVIYVGRITAMRMNPVGRVLAHTLRLIGAPLPIGEDIGVPSVVSVTEDVATGGQIWTRLYASNKHFPQVIHSAKRFDGPTGLEEYIGFGIVMALKIRATEDALTFENAGYYFKLGKVRFRIPRLLEPGNLAVEHRNRGELGTGKFEFTLALKHRLFGDLLYQAGLYSEEKP